MAINYDSWAQTYDSTRSASPDVVQHLRKALGPGVGRSLLDIGGGTGNLARALAHEGFSVVLIDHSIGMANRALSRLRNAPVVVGDAQQLPIRSQSVDCAISVKVFNHLSHRELYAQEARRVLREGPFVMLYASRETIAANWICEYVPQLATDDRYQPEEETVGVLRDAGFREVSVSRMWYEGDGSAQALKHDPERFLGAIGNTSLLYRLSTTETAHVISRIRDDHESGKLTSTIERCAAGVAEFGDGSIFVARP